MKFKDYRVMLGTQNELAKILKIDTSTVSKWESGLAYPRRSTLNLLAKIFQLTTGDVLDSIDKSKKER